MPHPNRVTPFNDLIATPARGALMGNRGILHDDQGRIVRPFAHRNWATCVLEFWGRYRQVMTPGRYTHLFSLDEATALAAAGRAVWLTGVTRRRFGSARWCRESTAQGCGRWRDWLWAVTRTRQRLAAKRNQNDHK